MSEQTKSTTKKKTTSKKTTTKKKTTTQPKLTKAEIELIKKFRKCNAVEKKVIEKAIDTCASGNTIESVLSILKNVG